MAIQSLQTPMVLRAMLWGDRVDSSSINVNSSNETAWVIGKIRMAAGPGTTKTISSAGGGSMVVNIVGSTFVTASTELRVGIQDVSSGLPDGTYDVYGAKIAGTDVITPSVYNRWSMSSGTKTLTHGDTVAFVVTMLNRAGADTVGVGTQDLVATYSGVGAAFPYGGNNTTKQQDYPFIVVTFDDGTYGWIDGTALVNNVSTSSTPVTVNGTPDEYIFTFVAPFTFRLAGVVIPVSLASGGSFEVHAYSDPYGSPSVLDTLAIPNNTTNFLGTPRRNYTCDFSARPVLTSGATYGVSVRSTSVNAVTVAWEPLGSGNEGMKAMCELTAVKLATRTDQTGVFVETDVTHVPFLTLLVDGVDVSSGGGGMRIVNGGLAG